MGGCEDVSISTCETLCRKQSYRPLDNTARGALKERRKAVSKGVQLIQHTVLKQVIQNQLE